MKKVFILLSVAVGHLILTKIVSAIALSVVKINWHENGLSFMGRSILAVSKVLYFPVFTFALYPRQFFPGNYIIIPLFFNSLLWALFFYILYVLIKHMVSNKDRRMKK